MSPGRVVGLALLVTSLVGSVAASAVDVKIDFDPSVDFAVYRTIGWGEGTLADDEELERRIHASIERELIPRGLKEVREEPDLLIVTHASMDRGKDIDVSQFDYWTEYTGWRRPLAVTEESWGLEKGVLVVDLLDGTSGRLVWRGIATGNVAKKPERRGEKLDNTMAKMFKSFPPRYKPGKAKE